MWQQIFDIIKPPTTINPQTLQEKPDYSMAIVGSVALVVVVVVVFIIIKKR